MNNQSLLTIKEFANVITEKGHKISGKELFDRLHNWDLIWVSGDRKKLPTTEARRSGYLDMVPSSKGSDVYGREHTTFVMVATKKGQEYILGRLMKELD
ncbi:phage antirepressor KilAC domain-containing protein [Sporosarcina sp. FSL K6-1508]|uniref:phage antirepressor KilAC domain-containing protein n=1 Tax=Sporosarcina sp. FSL K6-1508 TaxID=2921553 RepID=UPI0030FBB81D